MYLTGFLRTFISSRLVLGGEFPTNGEHGRDQFYNFTSSFFHTKVFFKAFICLQFVVCIFLDKGNSCKSCSQNVGEIDLRDQFHQSFVSKRQCASTYCLAQKIHWVSPKKLHLTSNIYTIHHVLEKSGLNLIRHLRTFVHS